MTNMAIYPYGSKLPTPFFGMGHLTHVKFLKRAASRFLAGQRSSSSRHFFDACGNVNLAATAAHPNPKRGVPE